MSPGPKMALAPARRLAEVLVHELGQACARIEVSTPEEPRRWITWRANSRDALDSALSGQLSVPSRFTQSTDSKGPRVRAGFALARTR